MASLAQPQASTSPTIRNKRPRPSDMDTAAPQGLDDGSALATAGFQHEDGEEDGDDDDDDEGAGKKSDKKAGRRKIKIEFIADKSRRHITFSKRKAGIMKKVRFPLPSSFCFLFHLHGYYRPMSHSTGMLT